MIFQRPKDLVYEHAISKKHLICDIAFLYQRDVRLDVNLPPLFLTIKNKCHAKHLDFCCTEALAAGRIKNRKLTTGK